MDSKDRENLLYSEGKRVLISTEELHMIEMLKKSIKSDQSLLDVGCGSGEMTKELATLGLETSGVDFSEVAIDLAKKNNVDGYVCDIDKGLNFNDKKFDFVWAGDVIEHVFDPIFVISECARVLKDNGTFYATIPHDLNWRVRIKTFFGISYQEAVYRKYNQYKHHTFFSERLMRYMYERAGLKIVDMYYVRGRKNKKISRNPIYNIFSTLMIVEAKKK